MNIIDIIVAFLIFLGSIYLLYHSLWKNKGHCSGCTSGDCKTKGIIKVMRKKV